MSGSNISFRDIRHSIQNYKLTKKKSRARDVQLTDWHFHLSVAHKSNDFVWTVPVAEPGW